ncbi:MAG TPA: MATE family efflux transporter [Candidatus Limnocylindria bacterium]|nr:MATE family efflux transporter [Candidatus Limnocylindria bacterium]
MGSFRSKFIGDRSFYKAVLAIAVPVVIQNSVTSSVNLLDNIMVGQLGTAQMSGVAIANQLSFIFYLCVFGGLAGPGIFSAQFYGAKDMNGLRDCFRIKVWLSIILSALGAMVLLLWQEPVVRLFLQGEGDPAQAREILGHARNYMTLMLPGFLPFALSMSYATTLRETGETMLPMKAGIVAVLSNLAGNWLLIFGNLGFPALGVRGAAVATVFSRLVELGILLYAVARAERLAFMKGVWRTLRVPRALLARVAAKGSPLLINEAMWSLGITTVNQIYSVRALLVLSALSISSTVGNLINVFFLSIGNAVAVMVGHSLGAGNMEKAREDMRRLIFLAFSVCLAVGLAVAALSPLFPRLYNIGDDARALAARFILISSLMMPVFAIQHCCYFVLRSGGSTIVTFLYDSAFTWVILIPVTYALAHFTAVPIVALFALSQATNLLKAASGLLLVRTGIWQRNLTARADKALLQAQG